MNLYKYVIPERIDILKGARVRFTQPSALNDPYEMKPYFEVIATTEEFNKRLNLAWKHIPEDDIPYLVDTVFKSIPSPEIEREKAIALMKQISTTHSAEADQKLTEMVNNLVETIPIPKSLIREFFFQTINKHLGVFCLTETAKNILMWTHYAQNYQGFVIEFDETHSFFHQHRPTEEEAGYLHPVVYVTKRPRNETLKELSPIDIFLTKSKKWEYEQEWRMLMPLEEADHNFGDDIFLFDVPPTCITGLILGSKMEDRMKQDIITLIASDARYPHIKLSQATLSETEFEIHISPAL